MYPTGKVIIRKNPDGAFAYRINNNYFWVPSSPKRTFRLHDVRRKYLQVSVTVIELYQMPRRKKSRFLSLPRISVFMLLAFSAFMSTILIT